jgi:hypothetical protein
MMCLFLLSVCVYLIENNTFLNPITKLLYRCAISFAHWVNNCIFLVILHRNITTYCHSNMRNTLKTHCTHMRNIVRSRCHSDLWYWTKTLQFPLPELQQLNLWKDFVSLGLVHNIIIPSGPCMCLSVVFRFAYFSYLCMHMCTKLHFNYHAVCFSVDEYLGKLE